MDNYGKRKRLVFKRAYLGLPYGAYMCIFIVIPMLMLVFYAFSKMDALGGIKWEFTFENFAAAFSSFNLMTIWTSVWMGLVATVICLVIGYPIAYFISNSKYNKSPGLLLFFILPMAMDFVLRTLATKSLFDFLNLPLGSGAVLFGMVYNFLPYMILPVYNSMMKIDKSLFEAASDLGAKEWQTLVKVVMPMTITGILSGVTMVFVPSVTTFVISDMLGRGKIILIGNTIENSFKNLQGGVGSAISLVILVVLLLSSLLINKLDKTDQGASGRLW